MTIPIDASLSLSQIKMSDAPALVKYLNHPTIYENTLMIPNPYTMGDAGWYINFVEERRQKFGRLTDWAIREQNGQVIGGIGFHAENGIRSHKDTIGYWLGAPYWRQGIMTRVVQTLTDLAFRELGLIRIEAPIFPHNIASARVLEKCGFVAEGLLRSYYLKNNHPIDVRMYARIKEENKSFAQEIG
jgi:RimJ/RimL family protein N-acetyltransferase